MKNKFTIDEKTNNFFINGYPLTDYQTRAKFIKTETFKKLSEEKIIYASKYYRTFYIDEIWFFDRKFFLSIAFSMTDSKFFEFSFRWEDGFYKEFGPYCIPNEDLRKEQNNLTVWLENHFKLKSSDNTFSFSWGKIFVNVSTRFETACWIAIIDQATIDNHKKQKIKNKK